MKEKAVIFDLDGTLCFELWREHLYEIDKDQWGAGIPFDPPIDDVYTMLHFISKMLKVKIIYLTGRNEKFRHYTLSWLQKYNCPPGPVYMREYGNQLRNAEYKRQVYENEIKKLDLDIMFAIDDNPSVIQMWKEVGILTVHVVNFDGLIPAIFTHTLNKDK